MILPNVWIKAAKIFKPNSLKDTGTVDSIFESEGIVFSKNNVCVHSITGRCCDTIHHPGYLTVSCENTSLERSSSAVSLRLTWISNKALWRKHPSKSKSSSVRNDLKAKSHQQFDDNSSRKISIESYDSGCRDCSTRESGNISITEEVDKLSLEYDFNYSEDTLKSRQGDHVIDSPTRYLQTVVSELSRTENNSCRLVTALSADTQYQLENETASSHISIEDKWKLSENGVKLDGCDESDKHIECSHIEENLIREVQEEDEVDKHCNNELYLRESTSSDSSLTSSPSRSRHETNLYSRFSVDLGNVKSLRLFFNEGSDSGQLVITSKENQYKILHFHRGGLQKLSDLLQQWNVFASAQVHNVDGQLYKHFKTFKPQIKDSELHPEEGTVSQLTENAWFDTFNEIGQIEDDVSLRKRIFFCGLPKRLRKFVWPFLLNCYPYQSTYVERNQIRNIRRRQYEEIENKRKELLDSEPEGPMKTIEYIIQKDVVRTDRSNPFYAGDDNPNVLLMKNVLLNYAVYDSDHIYMQGMSDLLAPILVEIPDEAEAFWCFVDIIKRGLFVCTPTDSDMEKNLLYLRELIRIMQPRFYAHLQSLTDGMDLLFCHRWLLLCFKREFSEDVVLQIWEACWSNYATDYFHLFISLAIIAVYSDDIVKQNLKSDDMLYHFNSLAMCMDGSLILQKARGLLYSFRMLGEVPLSLAILCQQREPGIWDSQHIPVIDC